MPGARGLPGKYKHRECSYSRCITISYDLSGMQGVQGLKGTKGELGLPGLTGPQGIQGIYLSILNSNFKEFIQNSHCEKSLRSYILMRLFVFIF